MPECACGADLGAYLAQRRLDSSRRPSAEWRAKAQDTAGTSAHWQRRSLSETELTLRLEMRISELTLKEAALDGL
jgi:hypothetical protein